MTPTPFQFNPDRVAYAEGNGWRAYYDRDWFKMLRLVVEMNAAQFNIPFPFSWLAAYHITSASIDFVPKDHDMDRVRAKIEKFYRLARRYSGLQFDPARVAKVEADYWDIHRVLAGKPDKTEFINTMIELHSLTFGLTPEQARESAELRVLANNTVDLITSKTSTDVEGDWKKLEDYLRQCYRSIEREVKKQ